MSSYCKPARDVPRYGEKPGTRPRSSPVQLFSVNSGPSVRCNNLKTYWRTSESAKRCSPVCASTHVELSVDPSTRVSIVVL